MLYEFISCALPFGDAADDSYSVYEAILHATLRFPKMVRGDHPARRVILKLLHRSPSQRGTPVSLKMDGWFKDMDWEALSYHFIKPKYKPRYKDIDTNKLMKGTLEQIIKKDEAKHPVKQLESPREDTEGWDDDF